MLILNERILRETPLNDGVTLADKTGVSINRLLTLSMSLDMMTSNDHLSKDYHLRTLYRDIYEKASDLAIVHRNKVHNPHVIRAALIYYLKRRTDVSWRK